MISAYVEWIVLSVNVVIILYRAYCIVQFDLWKIFDDIPEAESAFNEQLRVLIIVPLLREQGNVDLLLRCLSALRTGKEDRIVFVTTEKELSERKAYACLLRIMAEDIAAHKTSGRIAATYYKLFDRKKLLDLSERLRTRPTNEIYELLTDEYNAYPSTHEMLQQRIGAVPAHLQQRFCLVAYPERDGMMADQVNFGYTWATAGGQHYEYMCLLTGDSYVSPSFLERFKTKVEKLETLYRFRAPVIQCISLFGKNHPHAGMSAFENSVLQGNGVFQSGFSILNELLPMLQTERKIRQQKKYTTDIFSVPALIGHGCFIESRLFQSHSGFPANGWCEDIILTHIYTAQKAPILALDNEFELNEVPYSIRSLMSQMSTWAHSAVQLMFSPWAIFCQASAASGGEASQLHFYRCLIKRWALSLAWMINPPALIIFIVTGSWMGTLAILLNLLITFQTGYIYNRRYGLTGRSKYAVFLGCLFYFTLIYPAAFYYGAGKYLVSLFRPVEKGKTER